MPSIDRIETLGIVLTAACNLRCRYCYQNAKQQRRMAWETLERTFDFILKSRSAAVDLYFTGGEPLLEFPTMRRAIEHVERNRSPGKQIRYSITTNGTLLTEEIASFLADHFFDVQLSFDGVAEAQNVRGQDTFDTLDRLLDTLRERHPEFYHCNLTICATVTPSTVTFLPASLDYFLEKGVSKISLAPSFAPDPSWRTERIDELHRAFERVFESSMRHLRATGTVPVLAFRNRGAPAPCTEGGPLCGIALGRGFAVDVDGQAYGCAAVAGSYQEFSSAFMRDRLGPMRLGDIRDPEFADRFAAFPDAVRRADMFHGKERKYSSYRRCGECEYLSLCSVCPVSIGHVPGNADPHRMNDFCCAFNLASLPYRGRFPRERSMGDLRRASTELASLAERWKGPLIVS